MIVVFKRAKLLGVAETYMNSKNYTIETFFPTSIYTCDDVCVDILDDLETSANKVREEYGCHRNGALYVDSSHTTASFELKKIAPFDTLTKVIKEHVVNYATELGYDLTVNDLHMCNIWFNFSDQGDYNFPHAHAGCDFSGAFYVKANEENVLIVYDTLAMMGQYHDTHRDTFLGEQSVHYPLIPGRLMVWRSNTIHATPRQFLPGEKLVVSFNIGIKRNYDD